MQFWKPTTMSIAGEISLKKFLAAVMAPGFLALAVIAGPLQARTDKPNILVIWGDDIGVQHQRV